MKRIAPIIKRAVAALGALTLCVGMGPREAELFDELRTAPAERTAHLIEKITDEQSKSGSPAMDLLLSRGQEAILAGDMTAAVGHLTALVDHAPDFSMAYTERAHAYAQLGLYGPALDDARTALLRDPQNLVAMSLLASVLEVLGDTPRARAMWQRIVDLAPNDPEAGAALERLDAPDTEI